MPRNFGGVRAAEHEQEFTRVLQVGTYLQSSFAIQAMAGKGKKATKAKASRTADNSPPPSRAVPPSVDLAALVADSQAAIREAKRQREADRVAQAELRKCLASHPPPVRF